MKKGFVFSLTIGLIGINLDGQNQEPAGGLAEGFPCGFSHGIGEIKFHN